MTCDLPQPDPVVRLPANCSTSVAEDLRAGLVMALDHAGGVSIEAEETDNIGQAVLQLLIAAQREAAASGTEFAIRNLKPELVEQFEAYGLTDLIATIQDEKTIETEATP